MIELARIPISLTQLNRLISAHGGPGKPKAKCGWNNKGGEEIIPIEELYNEYKERIK